MGTPDWKALLDTGDTGDAAAAPRKPQTAAAEGSPPGRRRPSVPLRHIHIPEERLGRFGFVGEREGGDLFRPLVAHLIAGTAVTVIARRDGVRLAGDKKKR